MLMSTMTTPSARPPYLDSLQGRGEPGFLADVCDDENALGRAITVDDVEMRKVGAHLELTEPLRETVGEAVSGGGS